MDNVADFTDEVTTIDDARLQRIRRRGHEIVKDQATAEKLEPWYYSWCKRPCFHDEYLSTFNLPGVHLVDTDGQSVEKVTSDGLVVNGTEYPVDIIIWSTGYTLSGQASPSHSGGLDVRGRDGALLNERWKEGMDTLHSWTAPNFPNMFWAFSTQGSASVNYTHYLNVMTAHIAQVLIDTTRDLDGKKVVLEAKAAAAQEWGDRLAPGAIRMAPMAGCTPSYLNAEGALQRLSPEEQARSARKVLWPRGLPSFERFLAEWRAKGGWEGLDVAITDCPRPTHPHSVASFPSHD